MIGRSVLEAAKGCVAERQIREESGQHGEGEMKRKRMWQGGRAMESRNERAMERR